MQLLGVSCFLFLGSTVPGRHPAWWWLSSSRPASKVSKSQAKQDRRVPRQVVSSMERAAVFHKVQQARADEKVINDTSFHTVSMDMGVVYVPSFPH